MGDRRRSAHPSELTVYSLLSTAAPCSVGSWADKDWCFAQSSLYCLLACISSSPLLSSPLTSLTTLCPLSSLLLFLSLFPSISSAAPFHPPHHHSPIIQVAAAWLPASASPCQPPPASERCYWSCCTLQKALCVCVCVCGCVCLCERVCMSARRWESNWVREGCLSSPRCYHLPSLSLLSSSATMELQQAESQQRLQKGLR